MRVVALTTLAALGALIIAGCASAPAPEPFTVPPASAGAPAPAAPVLTPAEEQLFGPRVELPGGMLNKQIGKVAQFGLPGTTDPRMWGLRVVVDKIEVDPDCGEYATAPDRGHRLVISLRAETSEQYTPAIGVPQYYEWSTIGPDGVSEASPSSSSDCRSQNAFPHELRASAKYRGEVTVETANPAGQLVLSNFFVWDYPPVV